MPIANQVILITMNLKDNIILIDKPIGWTSFDVVAKIRGRIRTEYTVRGEKPTKRQLRVGHAGTLDPFATGLVIILIGEACKQAGDFLKLDKTYEFTAKLGEISTTGDPEGKITSYVAKSKKQIANSSSVIPAQAGTRSPVKADIGTLTIPTEKAVLETLRQFEGVISQVPPVFSAIKINGQRAYKLAREGKEVIIPPRNVTIYKIELVEYNYPYLKCVCDVSSGTYIRTLVQDIGEKLKTGAYCEELRRTKINNYEIKDAKQVEDIVN